MKVNEKRVYGVAWVNGSFRPIYQKPREIKRGRKSGAVEVIVRLFAGNNGFRKRIVDGASLRQAFI